MEQVISFQRACATISRRQLVISGFSSLVDRKILNYIASSFKSIFVALLASFFLLEAIGMFIHDNRYYFDQRYMTISADSIINQNVIDPSFWVYKPNSEVRSSAVYANFFNAKLEYDCKFKTNVMGFVDTGDIEDQVDFLVVGDSFTEGQGGCPWLTKNTIEQEERLNGISLLNGGFMSAGLRKFEQVLYYAQTFVSVDNLVVVAISNDFKRDGPAKWHVDRDCYKIQKCSAINQFYFRDFSISEDELIREAKVRRHERGPMLLNELARYSRTVNLLLDYKEKLSSKLVTEDDSKQRERAITFTQNFNSLLRMKNLYPNLNVILVPTRDEVGLLGVKNGDSQLVEKYLKLAGVRYSWCELTGADFLPTDGHPNKKGYRKLFDCVVDVVKR